MSTSVPQAQSPAVGATGKRDTTSTRNESHNHQDAEKIEVSTADTTDEEAVVPPDVETQSPKTLAKWNESPLLIFRFLSTIYSFILLGMSDAVLGALIPYVCLFTP